jgi:glycosyltransferase involved in cell wall biosynthesis
MNFKNNQKFEVIVSHPAKQGNIYERPLAAQRQGIPVTFLTGLYYKPEQFPYSLVKVLPSSRRAQAVRQLEKRRLQELNPESVISLGGLWPEALLRPLSLYRTWMQTHDLLAGQWISHRFKPAGPTLLHCFDDSAKRTIGAARLKDVTSVLEITLPIVVADLFDKECRRLGLSFHNTNHRNPWPAWWVRHHIEEYRAADYFIAQSRLTVSYLLDLGIPPGRIALLPLGSDIQRFQPIGIKGTGGPFRALFVGQVGIRKGLHHLLEAWTQLHLPNAELVLAGDVGREFGTELLAKYRGAYNWLGFVDADLPKVYRESDVFILPSLAEGAANVMYEAMASGLPCIVSNNVGCALRDGVEGFVIPVGDTEALKDRIERLYRDEQLRAKMGKAARRRAEDLTWEEYGRRLVLVYRKMLGGNQAALPDIMDMTES